MMGVSISRRAREVVLEKQESLFFFFLVAFILSIPNCQPSFSVSPPPLGSVNFSRDLLSQSVSF